MSAWCLLGVVVGALFASGALPWFAAPFRWVSQASAELMGTSVAWAVEGIGAQNSTWGQLATIMFAALAPGVIALLLVVVAQAGSAARRSVAGLVAGLGMLSFFVLPWNQAAVVLVVCLIVAVLAWAATGPLLVVPLVGTATALAVATGTVLWTDRDDAYTPDAQRITDLIGWPVELWRPLLLACAVAPFLFALYRAVFGPDRTPEQHVTAYD